MNLLYEFFPLLLFFAALLYKDIYLAVVVLMVTMPIALLLKAYRTKSLDKIYMWSTVFALVFGALTLYLKNPYFTYWKPTVFYWVLAMAFLGSTWLGEKPLAQRFFGLVKDLPMHKIEATQWKKLNLVWVAFFALAGALNLYAAYNYSEKTWATFKVFGLMGLTFVFLLGQTFWIFSLIGDEETDEPGEHD